MFDVRYSLYEPRITNHGLLTTAVIFEFELRTTKIEPRKGCESNG